MAANVSGGRGEVISSSAFRWYEDKVFFRRTVLERLGQVGTKKRREKC